MRPFDSGTISFTCALVLALAAGGPGWAQGAGRPAPDVGVGGTNSITPAIFTNARPPVTAAIKMDSLDLDYRKRLDFVHDNSAPGHDLHPRYHGTYTGACLQFELELFDNPMSAGSASFVSQFSNRGHTDDHAWTITSPRVVHGSPPLECEVRAVTYREGRVVKQAFETLSFFGAVAPAEDRAPLMVLYDAMGGSGWHNSANWNTDRPLDEWFGIEIDGSGRVVEIDLRENNLSGRLPSELGSLESLERLFLHNNNVNGPIPREFGSLANLDSVRLHGNDLSGAIPRELGNLTKLRRLRLNDNRLSGRIPAEVGNLERLEVLFLFDNRLSGEIPAELGRLGSLKWLGLHGNQLSGRVPAEVGRLADLELVSFSSNNLTGSLPQSMTNLGSLEVLWIHDNAGLCAPVDAAFRAWLDGVDDFQGEICGEDPAEGGDRATLTALYHATGGAGWNDNTNWLSDEPISTWYGVTTDGGGRVTHLRLQNNGLTGVIPVELASLESVTHLWFNDNDLTGSIPRELGRLANLGHFSVDRNRRLTGPVPPSFGNLSSLWTLRLEETTLSGALPQDLTNLRNLGHLSMHDSLLCAPDNEEFRMWVEALRFFSGRYCGAVPALPPVGALLLGVLVGLLGVGRLAATRVRTAGR